MVVIYKGRIVQVHSENFQGHGKDSLLLLKRTPNLDCWGPWVDYDGFVLLLADVEKATTGLPLQVDIFYAESDIMIGTGAGPRWFDDCGEQWGDKILFKRSVVPGADRVGILDLKYEVIQQILAAVSRPEAVREEGR